MDSNRIKFRVQTDNGNWRTVYCLHSMLMSNITLLKSYGIKFKVC